MASKKVNPQALAQLAKQKTASAAQFRKAEEADKKKVKTKKPSTTNTTPPSPPTTIDPEWEAIFGTPTTSVPTTTTTVPSIPTTPTTVPVTTTTVPVTTTTTTVPKKTPYGKPGEKVNIMGMSVTLDAEGNIDKKRYPYAWAIQQDILSRESEALLRTQGKIPEKSGGFWGGVGKIVGKGLEYTVVKPLMAIDTPRRVIISGIKETADIFNEGDASWKDFTGQVSDPNFGFGDVVQTGNKWVDRTIGFIGDVALDPTTYLTLGTGTAAKMAIKGASKYVAKEVVQATAAEIGTKTVKQLTKEAAEKIAKDLGKEAVDKEARTLARAVVVEAAQIAKAGAKGTASELAANKALKEATSRWAVAGPRRQLGAKTKEAMADGIRQLRDEALQEATQYAGTAAGRRAEEFAKIISDEVLVDIATRGYAALSGEVGRQLGIKGGFRLGVGRAKLPGTFGAPVTRGIGKVTAGARLKPLRGQGILGDAARTIADKITPQGADGLFNSEDVFDWRTGLRQARFKDAADYTAGVRAIELLGEDTAYRAAKKSAVNSTKAVLKESLADKAYKPFYKTVQEVLATDEIFWDSVRSAADSLDDDLVDQELINVARVLGRPLKEVEFAWKIKQGIDALYQSTVDLAKRGGADISGVGTTARPSSWYPLTVTNRTARWLKSAGRGLVGSDGKIIAGTSPREVAKQLNLRGIKLGTAVPDQLQKGMIFFGKELTDADLRGGIVRLNEIAREGGFQGDFFDTNIVSAIDRWANKWSGDYAFLKRYVDNLLGDVGIIYKSPLVEEERIAAGLPAEGAYPFMVDRTNIGSKPRTTKFASRKQIDEAIMSGVDDVEAGFANINDWSADDFELLREQVAETHAKAIKFANTAQRMMLDDAYKTLSTLIDQLVSIRFAEDRLGGAAILFDGPTPEKLLRGIYEGDDDIAAMFALTDDMMNQMSDYVRLFTKDKNQVLNFANSLDAQTLRTMVNLTEDAYVALNNQIVPNINVRSDIAEFYNNIKRYKDPKAAKGAIEFFKYYTNTFKTWATTSIGFHTRNMVSNAWQMLASGGNPKTLIEGARIYKQFNRFLDDIKNDIDYRKAILARAGFDDADMYWTGRFTPENLVEEFLNGTKAGISLSPTQKYAVAAALLDSGAVSAGDLEDIFGVVPVGARKVGFTGSEISDQLGTGLAKRVPDRLGAQRIPGALQKASEYAGILPAVSRQFGNNVEKLNRFMLTYDGIRQGYSAAESAARTSRFLVDYEDLSSADELMKQIIPFWMWLSRNLPVQIQNMYANPGIYQKYNNFRRNIEDENGDNPLLPNWLEESGAFKLFGTSGFNFYARPDFGFPGTGSPSPFIEGVTDPSSLAQGLNPALRTILETFTDRDLQYGTPIEGFGAKTQNIAEDVLTPASWLGRVLNIGAAQSDLPGPQWLQEILGVSGPEIKFGEETYRKDSPGWQPRVNALMSFLGVPGRIVGPNEENVARREYLRELEAYKKWLEDQG